MVGITTNASISLHMHIFYFGCNIHHSLDFAKLIEDIYSFAVNTINIVIECNKNISIFMSAKHE